MLSPALLGSGPVWWVGQKIHKEWRRDISDTAAETGSLLPAWVGWVGLGLPLLLLAKSGGKKTRRKKLDASDTAAQSEGVQCSHMKSS